MKNQKIAVLAALLMSSVAFAQDFPSIQTDRPDQTECPFIVPKDFFQLENGISYEKTREGAYNIVSPTILTRFGINDHFELRMITEYVLDKMDAEKTSGLNPVLVGFKARLFEEKGIVPLTSFIAHMSLPKFASQKYTTPYYAPEFRFTMQHTLSDKQSLSYNLGAEWNGETADPSFIYTLTTGYSLTDNLGAYVELYGFVPQIEKPDHRFDAGLTYLVNQHHQLDISGGAGFSATSPKYYFSLGYSLRFKI